MLRCTSTVSAAYRVVYTAWVGVARLVETVPHRQYHQTLGALNIPEVPDSKSFRTILSMHHNNSRGCGNDLAPRTRRASALRNRTHISAQHVAFSILQHPPSSYGRSMGSRARRRRRKKSKEEEDHQAVRTKYCINARYLIQN